MKIQIVAVLLLAVLQLSAAASLYFGDGERYVKRSIPENPEWNQLGWAWGKRSSLEIPRRLVRALHAVKKNPDWQDLGFAWGRK